MLKAFLERSLIAFSILCAPAALAAGAGFDYEALTRLIDQNRIRSVEALLPRLPAEFASHYTLMYDSGSVQPGSIKFPRALIYGEDASLVISFNGDPKLFKSAEKGESNPYYHIEILQYRKAPEARFELRNIAFPVDPRSSEPVVFSKANPPECMDCHSDGARKDPRTGKELPRENFFPLWAAFPKWPGAYGGNQDFRTGTEIFPGERGKLHAFIDAVESGDPLYARYRALPALREGYESPSASHNIALTRGLQRWNYEQMARLIRARAGYDDYKFSLLQGLFCHSEGRASFLRNFPDTFVPRISFPNTSSEEYGRYDGEYELRAVMGLLGSDIDDWFMTGIYDRLRDRLTGPEIAPGQALAFLLRDRDLEGFFDYDAVDDGILYPHAKAKAGACDALRSLSHDRLSRISTRELSRAIFRTDYREDRFTVFNSCIACHDGTRESRGRKGPVIPFANARELRNQLFKLGDHPRRLIDELRYRLSDDADRYGDVMPPKGKLEGHERAGMLRWLDMMEDDYGKLFQPSQK